MKTLSNIARLMALATLVLAVQFTFAQQAAPQPDQQKYEIKIVKDDNGKQEIINKTFDSQAGLEAYVKENKMDSPELNDLPALPAKKAGKMKQPKAQEPALEKKIIISESNADANGHTSLTITYENYNSEERATMIQNIINDKGSEPHVKVEIRKDL